MATIEEYFAPQTLEELTQTLAAGDTTILAGGTDLMPQTQSGVKEFQPTLVNVRRVAELNGLSESGGKIRIGALTTITDILENSFLRDKANVLVATANCFASGQVRNMATIGGNICNASPAGDMIIPLLLLDTEVELAWWADGKLAHRTIPLYDFFVGPGKTKVMGHEVLTCVRFPVPKEHAVAVFNKFGTRPALDISVVSVGISGIQDNGCLRDVRVALGAVAPTAIRGHRAEAVLEGLSLDEAGIAAVARVVDQDVSPISDVRASAWYRRHLALHLMEEVLRDVARSPD